jgi:hypothetical protein
MERLGVTRVEAMIAAFRAAASRLPGAARRRVRQGPARVLRSREPDTMSLQNPRLAQTPPRKNPP